MALGLVLTAGQLAAHTLPISYLFLVTDTDYVHLELSFNPFELSNFAEFDTNRNSQFDADELPGAGGKIARQLLDHLTLRVDDKVVAAETSGISPEADTHHATLRAHYRVDARHAALALESSLPEVTSSSHLTQVNFLRAGKRELAQLDVQSHQATFALPAGERCDPALSGACASCQANSNRGGMIAMSIGFGLVLLLTFQKSRRATKATPLAARLTAQVPSPKPPTAP